MHVMMTKEQFEELKKKAKSGGAKSNGKPAPKMELKEDDDTHGTIDTDDVMLNYYYNASEGRLNFGISKRHTLAAYCASESICTTFIMDKLSEIPSSKKDAGAGSNKSDEGGGSEGQEKKDQSQHQDQNQQNQ